MRVLIIDDNEIDLFVTKRLFEIVYPECSIRSENSANAALAYLDKLNQENIPDYIFLDIEMPLMDGLAFLNEYEKTEPSLRNRSRIIIASAFDEHSPLFQQALQYKSVYRYLVKPLFESHLKEFIQN